MILLLGFYVVKVKGFVIIYSSLSVLKKVVINDFLARSTSTEPEMDTRLQSMCYRAGRRKDYGSYL